MARPGVTVRAGGGAGAPRVGRVGAAAQSQEADRRGRHADQRLHRRAGPDRLRSQGLSRRPGGLLRQARRPRHFLVLEAGRNGDSSLARARGGVRGAAGNSRDRVERPSRGVTMHPHGLLLFAHVFGFVLWLGGGMASMVVGVTAKNFAPDERLAAYRATGKVQTRLVGPGALVVVLSGGML